MKLLSKFIPATLCALLLGGAAHGVPYVDTFDDSAEGWTARPQIGGGGANADTVGNAVVGGRDALEITAGTGADGFSDYIYNSSTAVGGILDKWGTDLTSSPEGDGLYAVTFQFYAGGDDAGDGNFYPGALEFYFMHDAGGGNNTYWTYTFDVLSLVSGWNTLSVFPIIGVTGDGNGWSGANYDTGTVVDFQSALASVEEIGVLLTYGAGSGQVYGLDDFTLVTPEPGTYALLAFAMLGVGVTFRGKIREGIATLRRQ